jgi:hypothetical protein
MSLSQTLVVPVDVRAFCVGTGDASVVSEFNGVTLDFAKMTPASNALGAAIIARDNGVFRDAPFSAGAPLAPGIHLHWNLPRALTHGQADPDTGNITFPLVPNRWLITRIADTPNPFQYTRSWVVESDHIAETPPDGAVSITIFTGYDSPQPYRYLGRVVPAEGWTEPEPNGSVLKQMTLSDLTVMQTGDPLFASFYPNCRNVFGLHDDLSDVGDALEGERIMYVVAGWYGNPANDPLHGMVDAATLLDQFKWSVPDDVTGSFQRSLHVGQVQGIVWHEAAVYVTPDQPVEVTLGLGGNGAEAMSALLGATVDDLDQRTVFENFLSAYQLGVISTLHEPHPDRMTEMLDKLHAAGFTHMGGGTVWSCVQDNTAQSPVPLADLPVDVTGALADLNRAQAAWDAADAQIDGTRRQLHLDWYRYGSVKLAIDNGSADPDDLTRLDNLSEYIRTEIHLLLDGDHGTEVLGLLAAKNDLDAKQTAAATAAAAHGWVLKALIAPWYWRPNDPIVGLSGPELVHRLQGTDASAPVFCRPADRLLQALTVCGHALESPATGQGVSPPVDIVPVGVWDEALLLDTSWLGRATGGDVPDLQNAVQAFLAGGGQDTAVVTSHDGLAPIADAMQWWTGANPWLPVFMWWTADYYPVPGYDGQLQPLPAKYVTGHFTLGEDGVLVPNDGVLDQTQSWPVSGQAILTPLLTRQMEQALSTDEVDPDMAADIVAAQKYLEETPILYQALSGFTDALLMLGQIPQLVGDTVDGQVDQGSINGDLGLFHLVSDHVGSSMRLASYANTQFAPLRAGSAAMEVTLVDVFGRRRKGTQVGFRCAPPMRIAQEEANKRVFLPPRFSQPVRLGFNFLSAVNAEEASPLVSPVCGWLLPNHLDDALMTYDTDGVPRGMLDLLSDQVHWVGVPGPHYGEDLDTAMAGANPHQIDLVRALRDGEREALGNLLQAVDTIQATTTGSISQDPALSLLIGRPMVLVQVTLSLDLLGSPAVNQGLKAFDADWAVADMNDPDSFVGKRMDNGLAGIEVEVILGGVDRFRDGVLGFFIADDQGQYDFSQFHSPAGGPGIAASRVTLSIGGPALQLLMLVDPLSDIHAVSDMLPTRSLTIPPDWTVPVLDKLSVTFPVRPVLAASANFELPLPAEAGYGWSWVQHQGADWSTLPIAKRPSALATPYVPQRIFSGWLKLSREDDEV